MLLIYVAKSTPRLQYICQFIFKELLGLSYSLTLDGEGFKNHDGPKINYSDLDFEKPVITLRPHSLLFETGINIQLIQCLKKDGDKIFFSTAGSDLAFDIFAASFYLISRYEEYLPHKQDIYGRYAHENSIAYQEGFLNVPLVNKWVLGFGEFLKKSFPELRFQFTTGKFIATYDIDLAWSYKRKGVLRNLGGFLKAPSAQRIKVLLGMNKDPYDSYDFLDKLHSENNLEPIYFFLVANKRSLYDKNIPPTHPLMAKLIKDHAQNYKTGLHPSWKSNDSFSTLLSEKKILETTTGLSINSSRQHYIKFCLPTTFENLIAAGITDDYSMGYGSINGFRASVASSFYWYNLPEEKITALRIHPFCYMDANCFYEEKLNVTEAFVEMRYYFRACRLVNGNFISIFHNNFLGTDKKFRGWKEEYEKFISQAQL